MKRKANTILITGATARLGLAMAQQCLAMGFDVVAHYRSTRAPAQRWLRAHPEYAKRMRFVNAELNDPQGESVVQWCVSQKIALCGLINSASVFTPGDLRDAHHFEHTLRTNALTPLRLAQEFAVQAPPSSSAWIVNITDANIRDVNARFQNYRTSKLLLSELTRQLAITLAPRIRVNAIAPGAILPARGKSRDEFAMLTPKIPLHRTGAVADIQKALQYLIEADYVTGQVMAVDGGWGL